MIERRTDVPSLLNLFSLNISVRALRDAEIIHHRQYGTNYGLFNPVSYIIRNSNFLSEITTAQQYGAYLCFVYFITEMLCNLVFFGFHFYKIIM